MFISKKEYERRINEAVNEALGRKERHYANYDRDRWLNEKIEGMERRINALEMIHKQPHTVSGNISYPTNASCTF